MWASKRDHPFVDAQRQRRPESVDEGLLRNKHGLSSTPRRIHPRFSGKHSSVPLLH